jgi:hypothetical protein
MKYRAWHLAVIVAVVCGAAAVAAVNAAVISVVDWLGGLDP